MRSRRSAGTARSTAAPRLRSRRSCRSPMRSIPTAIAAPGRRASRTCSPRPGRSTAGRTGRSPTSATDYAGLPTTSLRRCTEGGNGIASSAAVPFAEAVRTWVRVAANSFGGPAGQIAVMHRILVEEKRWISEERFLHAMSYCMLLPGPEAQQLATYVGWLLHRTRGGLVAGTLFVLPGFVTILALSLLYTAYGHLPLVEGLFFGLKPAVLALVLEAGLRIGRRALGSAAQGAIAVSAFIAIALFDVGFPWIVLAAGLAGLLG